MYYFVCTGLGSSGPVGDWWCPGKFVTLKSRPAHESRNGHWPGGWGRDGVGAATAAFWVTPTKVSTFQERQPSVPICANHFHLDCVLLFSRACFDKCLVVLGGRTQVVRCWHHVASNISGSWHTLPASCPLYCPLRHHAFVCVCVGYLESFPCFFLSFLMLCI